MKMNLSVKLLTLCSIAAVACGCGGSGLPSGETGTVSGQVVYNGSPVPEGCTVLFMRSEGGISGVGTTDSNGNYKLAMRDGEDILVGTYRVSVNPPTAAATLSDEEMMELSMKGEAPEAPEVKEVPETYRSPETSPLSFDVKSGENKIDIELAEAAS